MAEAFPDDVLLDLQIPEDEVRPVAGVGDDAAYERRRQKDVFRLFPVKEFPDGRRVFQVQFPVGAADEMRVAPAFQRFPDGGPHQPAVPGHEYPAIFVHA